MKTTLLTITVLSLPNLAEAADRDPLPVDQSIIERPTTDDISVLLSALRGCGCKPKHHPVRDAIVKVGQPIVPGLTERLRTSRTWSDQLECVYLLGLIGPEAHEAITVLENTTQIKHKLPRDYSVIALAAIQRDPVQLVEILESATNSRGEYAAELLIRMGQEAAMIRPQLVELIKTGNERARKSARMVIDHLGETSE